MIEHLGLDLWKCWKMDAFVTDHVSKVRKAYGRNTEKKGE